MGLFHTLDEELTDSPILTCRWHEMENRWDFNKVLKKQEEVSALKIQFAKEKKMDVTKSQWNGALYVHQKYNSPRCAMTATQTFKEFDSLKSSEVQNKMIFMGHQMSSCRVPVVRSFFILWKILLSPQNLPYDHLQICTNITFQYPRKWPYFILQFILLWPNINFSCPKKSHRHVP